MSDLAAGPARVSSGRVARPSRLARDSAESGEGLEQRPGFPGRSSGTQSEAEGGGVIQGSSQRCG